MKMEFTDQTGPFVIKHNPQPLLRSILIALVYLIPFILLDLITKQFEGLPGIVTWYPPAGLTYALLLVFGARFTPAVTIALFLSSVFIYRMPQPPLLLLLWSFVISLIYAAAAWFLRHRIHLDWQLRKLRDVAWLVGTAVLVSAFLAVLSVSSSTLSSAMPRSDVLHAIFHWWIGEAVGVLTVTPFLLVYVMPWLKRFVDGQSVSVPKSISLPGSALTFIGQAASLVLILYWVFGTRLLEEFHPFFLLSLPLIWIALNRGFKKLTVAIMALNFGVVLATWLFGFDVARLEELELLMIVICMVGLLMGAVVTERTRDTEEIANLAKYPSENPGPVMRLNRDGIVMDANPASAAVLEMWGCSLGGSAPRFWCDLAAQVLASGENKTIDIEIDRKVYSMFVTPVTGSGYVNLYGRDITERKQSELMLRESEERYRDLVENSQELICTHDLEGRILSSNPAGAKMLGLEMEALLKMNIRDILAPDGQAGFESYISSIKNDGKSSGLMLVQTSSGEKRLWEYNNTLRKEGVADPIVRGMARDITASKRAEALLLESELKFRTIFDRNLDGILLADMETRLFFMGNISICEMLGYTQDELSGMSVDDIHPLERLPYVLEQFSRQARGEITLAESLPVKRKDGSVFYADVRATSVTVSGHIYIMGIFHDITASKQAEEALRESEKEFHFLAEAMPQMVWITRPDGWNIYFNQRWVDYTGLTLEESYGHGWNKPFHPDDQQRAWDAWQNATNNGAVYSLDCRLRRADGVYKWWLIRGVPVLDAEGTILKWFGTCTDIDELKQTENEIKTQLDELQRWQAATLSRENRILELKHEVNELLAAAQRSPRYPSAESQDEQER